MVVIAYFACPIADRIRRAGLALEACIDKEIRTAMNQTSNTATDKAPDSDTSPSYYSRFKIQPKTYIEQNKLNFFEGNVIKYVTRAPHKGSCLLDLKKARSNIDDLIRVEEERLAEVKKNENALTSAKMEKMLRDMPPGLWRTSPLRVDYSDPFVLRFRV